MKKSKWLMALGLTSALFLAACSSDDKESTESGEQNKLEQVQDAGKIVVGIMGTYAPYNYLGEDGEYTGYDVEIASEVAERLDVEAEFVAQEFSGLIPSLQQGKYDMLVSQVTITPERQEVLDFSNPYITNNVKVIVQEENTDILSVKDFPGRKIGVGLGTNDETYLRTTLMPEVGDFKINTYDDVITTLADLDAGRIDATINNEYALKPVVEKNGYKIKSVGEPIKSDKAGIAVAKGEKEFVEAINGALDEMKEDGTYAEIFEKWFGEAPPAE